MARISGGGRTKRDGTGSVLEGSWVWIALPVGILALIAALWFLVIAPAGGAPPRVTVTPTKTATAWPTLTPVVFGASTTSPAAPTGSAAPAATAKPTTIQVGAKVLVTGTGSSQLRVRQSPGTSAGTLKMLPDGTPLVVVDGPQQANDMTWWKVDDGKGAVGWAAAPYLKLAP